jgi:hypothetical protein
MRFMSTFKNYYRENLKSMKAFTKKHGILKTSKLKHVAITYKKLKLTKMLMNHKYLYWKLNLLMMNILLMIWLKKYLKKPNKKIWFGKKNIKRKPRM